MKGFSMTTISATKARSMFYKLMNDIDEPVTITGKNGNKILISEDDWRAIEETNYLMSVPGLAKSIKEIESTQDFLDEEEVEW